MTQIKVAHMFNYVRVVGKNTETMYTLLAFHFDRDSGSILGRGKLLSFLTESRLVLGAAQNPIKSELGPFFLGAKAVWP
jgi:hypothetical protein